MANLTTILEGREYPLAANLRVAYTIQGQHNHKPYAEVFKGIGDMPVEQQIDIIYAAFKCANPEAVFEWTQNKFREYYLDNFNLKDLLEQMQTLVKRIMGEEDTPETSAESTEATEGAEGN